MYPQVTRPTDGVNQVNPDRIIDRFVRSYLEMDLMKMSPKDGWVAEPEHTWVLAGGPMEPVVISSLSGNDISFARALPAKEYNATWFDPRTGTAQAPIMVSGAAHTVLSKPDAKEWLLLLQPKKG
jgi:hypothetical protein